MTLRHCRACNDWHDLDQLWPEECFSHFRSGRPSAAPNIISDNIELKSMADGRMYTSKRGYYESLKRNNCEITDRPVMKEGPNNPGRELPRAGFDLKRAWGD